MLGGAGPLMQRLRALVARLPLLRLLFAAIWLCLVLVLLLPLCLPLPWCAADTVCRKASDAPQDSDFAGQSYLYRYLYVL